MAGKDYLAMYLTVQTELLKPSHFIPIMHFAESNARLRQDIEDDAFYTNEVRLGMAMERIRNQTPFQISVLFWSTLPATGAILSKSAITQMSLIAEDIKAVLNPPQTAPTIMPPEVYTVSIRLGMKNKTNPYPKDFVKPLKNFNSGRFEIQFSQAKVKSETAFIKNNFFTALKFYHVTGQVFMTSDDPP